MSFLERANSLQMASYAHPFENTGFTLPQRNLFVDLEPQAALLQYEHRRKFTLIIEY